MKTAAVALGLLAAAPSALAFAPSVPPPSHRASSRLNAEIGDTGVSFENVAREWRCKYSPGPSGGPGDSESLKACQSLLDEYLPKLKELPGASITRQVCGGCLDFKVSITQPLEEHGAWADADYQPLEGEFMEKLKGIEGTSMHEVQEITFEAL
uniref:Uncharacterized protein n=1 Tax=Trieres chinensis TaxID=1514140 RepID=A0A7S1Z1T9_TRICV|eukprot:CAMPEP_0183294814 /NCGR_PEP_ID=MMETSP0160_2-20130417/2990_1 /TAXON_ID=2839 ORGANISM="Odontella Sinensis, Strain Grunow 1884" /NCGR_SAMPLE_ID=MMETSP0160_2 /ASSEMBLY_ACC=CAM_ASM_000250 /LENGTH=153 /DNA_ID=CAMNT_0025456183 /DNA_START=47 /DNA_END=508 /DNA_ORIENTATION=+